MTGSTPSGHLQCAVLFPLRMDGVQNSFKRWASGQLSAPSPTMPHRALFGVVWCWYLGTLAQMSLSLPWLLPLFLSPLTLSAHDVFSVMGSPHLCAAEKKHQPCQGTFSRLSPRQLCIGCRGWRCGTEIVASHISSPKMAAALLPLQCASSLPLAKGFHVTSEIRG